jgi:hypothetical protein
VIHIEVNGWLHGLRAVLVIGSIGRAGSAGAGASVDWQSHL